MKKEMLLEVSNLKTHFFTDDGVVKAVDGVSFEIHKGETLGVVGESGCGKSITAQSVMQLLPYPKGRVVEGSILYHQGENVIDIAALKPASRGMRRLRGNEISMVFQEPMTSLNPVHTIGRQIMEVVIEHQNLDKKRAKERAVEMLSHVGISAPAQRVDEYPHQLSGGMRQRAVIAMGLACDPNLLIADEPTTALDVTVEAQILELMNKLQDDLGMAIMFITHDLGVIGEMADRVVVMYSGKVVEYAETDKIFYEAHHPYTQGLLKSRPAIGRHQRLVPVTGTVPNPLYLPKGCYFAPRCPHAMDICRETEPAMFAVGEKHWAKCWLHAEKGEGTA